MTVLLAFGLGLLVGWLSFPTTQVAWRYGPVAWTRVGAVGLFEAGSTKFAKVGRRWRRVSRINAELTEVLES